MVMSAGLRGSAGQEQSTPRASLEGRFEKEGNPLPWLSAVVLPCLGCHRQTETGHGKGEVPAAGPTGQEHGLAPKFLGTGAKKEEEVATGSSGATCALCLVLSPPRI